MLNFSKIRAVTNSDNNLNRGYLTNPKFVRANQNVILDCRVEAYNEDWDKVEWCKNEVCVSSFNSLNQLVINNNTRGIFLFSFVHGVEQSWRTTADFNSIAWKSISLWEIDAKASGACLLKTLPRAMRASTSARLRDAPTSTRSNSKRAPLI